MPMANDGWFGSRLSLSSNKEKKATSKIASGQTSVDISQRPSYNNLLDARSRKTSATNVPSQEAKERKKERKISQTKPTIQESVAEDCPSEKAPQDLKEEEKLLLNQKLAEPVVYPDVLKTAAKKLAEYKEEEEEKQNLAVNGNAQAEEEVKKIGLLRKIAIFFDFDLLKDPVYLNLMLGITIANFVEINFSIITPFVLKEFDFEKYQIATFMSLLGATDICVRFIIPFLAEKIGWQNKTFFLVGVLGMALGRISKQNTLIKARSSNAIVCSFDTHPNVFDISTCCCDNWIWKGFEDDIHSVSYSNLCSFGETACSIWFATSF